MSLGLVDAIHSLHTQCAQLVDSCRRMIHSDAPVRRWMIFWRSIPVTKIYLSVRTESVAPTKRNVASITENTPVRRLQVCGLLFSSRYKRGASNSEIRRLDLDTIVWPIFGHWAPTVQMPKAHLEVWKNYLTVSRKNRWKQTDASVA